MLPGCIFFIVIIVAIFMFGAIVANWIGMDSNAGMLFGGIFVVVAAIIVMVKNSKK